MTEQDLRELLARPVEVPPEVEAHVEKLDFVLGTGERAHAADCWICAG